jgi:hypothetical protein
LTITQQFLLIRYIRGIIALIVEMKTLGIELMSRIAEQDNVNMTDNHLSFVVTNSPPQALRELALELNMCS